MSANEIHVGDIGTIFEVTVMDGAVVVDISTASVKQFVFRKPDRTLLTKAALFATDGTDGKLRYTTILNDLDPEGGWQLQVHLTLPTGDWRSDIQSFVVFPNVG